MGRHRLEGGATVTEAQARAAHRALRAIWVIASCRHDDALARDVAAMGERLRSAIDGGDLRAAATIIGEVRRWLTTMGGVILARMEHVFAEPLATGEPRPGALPRAPRGPASDR